MPVLLLWAVPAVIGSRHALTREPKKEKPGGFSRPGFLRNDAPLCRLPDPLNRFLERQFECRGRPASRGHLNKRTDIL
jgi:hypothetical protein